MCIPRNAGIMFLGLKSFFDLIMNNMLFFPLGNSSKTLVPKIKFDFTHSSRLLFLKS